MPLLRPRHRRSIALLLSLAIGACEGTDAAETPLNPLPPDERGDQETNHIVTIYEAAIRAAIDADGLVLRLPVQRAGSGPIEAGLTVELLSVAGGAPLATRPVAVTLAEGEQSTMLDVHLALPANVSDSADLASYNVRVHDGTSAGLFITRSAFAALPRYEVRLEGPARVSAQKSVSYRVRAHDPRTFAAVPAAPVELVLTLPGGAEQALSGETDEHGDAFFELSLEQAGDYQASARASAAGTEARLSQSVVVESGSARLLLTTDKPIYQPGQTVHLRALALEKGSNEPLAATPVRFEILDAKGNKLFKREITSDAYGIAAASFKLGSVLNLGGFRATATFGELVVQKTFEVSRYVLPKFAIDVGLDKSWYRPGDTLQGDLDARYYFGRKLVEADVEITASTLDIGQSAFARVVGKTSAEGKFPFSVKLPASLVGLPLDQGNALVSLHVKVTDAAGQVVEKDVAAQVADKEVQVLVVPEATALVAGVPNALHVFVTDPGGAPIEAAEVSLSVGSTSVSVVTDAFGQALAELTPPPANTTVVASVVLEGGAALTEVFAFAAQAGQAHVVVSSDHAVYDVGETATIAIAASEQGSVYVDWLHEGQAVDQRTLEVEQGTAQFDVALDTTLAGNNRIEAYIVDAGGNVVRAGTTLFVREGGALDIQLATDKPSYAPGESAALTFSVKDEAGQPKVAALGVQIVDEAVFGLIDAKPGLLRTYFELDDAFAEPHYQIGAPAGSLPGLLFGATDVDDPVASEAAQQRAKATFAALGDMGVTGIHAGSWQATVMRVRELVQPAYAADLPQITELLERLRTTGEITLRQVGCTPQQWCTSLNRSFETALLERMRAGLVANDAWGRPYRQQEDWGAFKLQSDGPDETSGTDDDGSLQVAFEELGLTTLFPPNAVEGDFDGDRGEEFPVDDAPGIAVDAGALAPGPGGDGDSSGDGDGDGEEESAPRVRREFPETLYVNPAVITGPDGNATIELPLADSITEWRVSTLANAPDGRLGGATHGITVFQDFFVDIAFPASLTRGDEVSFPIALYNYLDEPQTVSLSLETAPWFTALGSTSASVELAPNAVQGVSFPVRVEDVGVHTLTVQAIGTARSDAVERSVRVVPDGKAFPTAQSGALAAGAASLSVTYPGNAVPGSGELSLSIFPAFLSSVVSGMDSMLQEPYGCFEQTTSTTWPNVLALRYMRDTQQVTPEIELKAESYISAGYQRLLTFEHPGGGFSWFGTQDPAPFLSVTAFGVMEFADMAKAYDVDPAMLARTIDWLVAQQEADGTWQGDQTEFFSFHTSKVRNTAFVVWALSSAGHQGADLQRGLSYLTSHWNENDEDGYTLALVANAFATAAPTDPALNGVLTALDALKQVDGDAISWDAGQTQTDFYGYGNDAEVTTTALVAHALLTLGSYPDLVQGAFATLLAARDQQGNFGSTQATIWTLRTLLLAARKGTEGAVGTVDVAVDGQPFTSVALTADQADVLTTIDLASLATTGQHEVLISFAGTGKVSYNLVSSYHLPWSEVPAEAGGPLAVRVQYDRAQLAVNDTVQATVEVENLSDASANMILVDVGIPPGFSVETDDLDVYLSERSLSKYEVTPRQLILYVSELAANAQISYQYRLRATMPVRAADGGARVYPYYEPDRKSFAASTTLEATE